MTSRGFWLDLGDVRLFVSFRAFPWFREFTVKELTTVRRPSASHIRWPHFDIDFELESLEHPDRYRILERRLRGDPCRVVERLRAERRRKIKASA